MYMSLLVDVYLNVCERVNITECSACHPRSILTLLLMTWSLLLSSFWLGSTNKKGREVLIGDWSVREKGQDTSPSFMSQVHFGRVLRAASFLRDCRPFCVLLTAVLAPATPVLTGLPRLPGVVTASHLGKLWVL